MGIEQADMLQTLRGASRAMLSLVEDVLDFSKIEAGKLTIERADFDLHALVNSTCRIVSAQAALKGVDFVVSMMPEVPPAVRGDPHHLRQVLLWPLRLVPAADTDDSEQRRAPWQALRALGEASPWREQEDGGCV